ncbi:CcdB family protein [Citrobacter freundii]|nr:CcdB family protein [Citrobacter freundii]HCB1534868.1 CcdB family protein [Citrobacter braakii]HDT6085544.1 CcdB family protein [Citrobacter braakii]HEE0094427.1 CcdB family protein [Citrobacter braakii]HEE9880316.1 CcdB family protein [Citrobacter braakii]
MNQGTVFRRPDNPEYPYFVIAQSDQLIDLNTRVIIPFVRWRQSLPGMSKINPVVNIDDERYILMTQLIQTVYLYELDEEDIHSYRPEMRDLIVSAVDFLTTGS